MQQRVQVVGLGEVLHRHGLEPKDKLSALLSKAREAVLAIDFICSKL
jgi:hypothetical protein